MREDKILDDVLLCDNLNLPLVMPHLKGTLNDEYVPMFVGKIGTFGWCAWVAMKPLYLIICKNQSFHVI